MAVWNLNSNLDVFSMQTFLRGLIYVRWAIQALVFYCYIVKKGGWNCVYRYTLYPYILNHCNDLALNGSLIGNKHICIYRSDDSVTKHIGCIVDTFFFFFCIKFALQVAKLMQIWLLSDVCHCWNYFNYTDFFQQSHGHW